MKCYRQAIFLMLGILALSGCAHRQTAPESAEGLDETAIEAQRKKNEPLTGKRKTTTTIGQIDYSGANGNTTDSSSSNGTASSRGMTSDPVNSDECNGDCGPELESADESSMDLEAGDGEAGMDLEGGSFGYGVE